MLGPHQFSLQAAIALYILDITLILLIVAKRDSITTAAKLLNMKIEIPENSSKAYLVIIY